MATTLPSKQSYHPLLQFMYYAGCLDDEIIKQIPATTIQYWKSKDHTQMHGYEWVKDTFTD
jgi:hypothetical protein